MKFVIVGLGSIGKRHQKNLQDLGHQVIPAHHQDNLKQMLAMSNPAGVLICTPTSQHLQSTLTALAADLPVFVEKPLSHNLAGIDQLKGKVLVGYCLRFDQSLNQFKAKIDTLDKSEVKSVKIVCSSWLPDWHPGSDYRKSYSAKKELGGGVLLDLSHEIDYALWFFGAVKNVKTKLQQSPELKIETETIADLNLEFTSGVKVDMHLSYASHENERFCEIATNSEILRWDFQPNNQMYVEEIKHFVDVAAGKSLPLVTVDDGRRVLEVIVAAKRL